MRVKASLRKAQPGDVGGIGLWMVWSGVRSLAPPVGQEIEVGERRRGAGRSGVGLDWLGDVIFFFFFTRGWNRELQRGRTAVAEGGDSVLSLLLSFFTPIGAREILAPSSV